VIGCKGGAKTGNDTARVAGEIVIVAELDGGGLRDEGQRAASDALQAHPNLRGIFAINDPSALGAWTALQQQGKEDQIVIVGFDGQEEGLQAIKEGKIYADPIQFPAEMGVVTVQNIVKYINGEDFERTQLIPTKLYTKADAMKADEAAANGQSDDTATNNDSPDDEPADGESTDAPKEQGKIAFSALTLKNPFFKVIADSLTAEAKKHGFSVIVNDAERDVNTQSQHVDNYIAQNVTAIVLNPADRIGIGAAVKKANAAGVPVFTCDLQCVAEGAEIAGHVGTDNYQGGKLAGQAMIDALGAEGGEVLILHFKQANSCVLRVQGFREVIEAHNKALREKSGASNKS
jgi:ABC-type sugar transport system substrate-binding protein